MILNNLTGQFFGYLPSVLFGGLARRYVWRVCHLSIKKKNYSLIPLPISAQSKNR
jgi:hypothetical protein